jgi:hypothetical protein
MGLPVRPFINPSESESESDVPKVSKVSCR